MATLKQRRIKMAMKHEYKLGAGAERRRKYLHTPEEKIETVMKEWKRGTLMSGSGQNVTNRKQAIAIALSEARKSRKKKRG